MKLISWNVNGIRSVIKKGFLEFVKKHNPDVLCLQEIKANAEVAKTFFLNGYELFWNHAERPGYSGTAVFTKVKPQSVACGLGIEKHDSEGRVITVEYADFYLVNVYVPNSKRELERLPYRAKEWDVDFLKHLKKLEKKKPVIFCGDMNVAHKEIDLTYPKANVNNHGFTPEERAGFDNIVKAGFIDTFREFHQDGGHYTWWSPMSNCRAKNIGWRIDYFCVSASLKPRLKESTILKDVLGSDHCPVELVLK
ncbi:MAG: exodeoxyribonuclease III [Omnitrophica WOR_2 bacterium RIFCSPHIGHO2_01_FULL_48_9]|nr:MAG: exodeoxyribonuclease III [Omnitrophica WOR_2 bacterium RIFCSPHIGHO2_02_FULL_48_11]OGX31485.1 MAG: exodeoxyribonuclease III [Omnitrophica WOR_2 bacterium RIFCSPHIGHO2_01_FULL_48_9]